MVDCIAAVEAAYDIEGTTEQWLAGIGSAVHSWLDRGFGVMLAAYDATDSADLVVEPPVLVGCPAHYGAHISSTMGALGSGTVRSVANKAAVLTMFEFCEGDLASPLYAAYRDNSPRECPDCLVISAPSPEGRGVFVGAPLPAVTTLAESQRRAMAKVGVHIAAGLRLRRTLRAHDLTCDDPEVAAILTPAGHVEHAVGEARALSHREALREQALAIDRARSQKGGRGFDAVDLWRGLVAGRWSLIDRFDSDGRHYLIALKNDPAVQNPRALSLRERQVAALVGAGYPNKLISYALGMSQGAVSRHLHGALRKLGLQHRGELCDLVDPEGPDEY